VLLEQLVFAAATGGPWNALDNRGCGNAFEKHAYTYFNPWTGGPNPNEISASQYRDEGAEGTSCRASDGAGDTRRVDRYLAVAAVSSAGLEMAQRYCAGNLAETKSGTSK
jgi:hypothetical protein